MYYGFALVENPQALRIETNMPRYLTPQRQQHNPLLQYWLGVYASEYAVLVNMRSNNILRANRFAPALFTFDRPAARLLRHKTDTPRRERVNVAVYFDLTRFPQGEQRLSLQSTFVNRKKGTPIQPPDQRQIYAHHINLVKL